MKNVIGLLADFEENSAKLYDMATLKFKDDPLYRDFLAALADDERSHHDYLVGPLHF